MEVGIIQFSCFEREREREREKEREGHREKRESLRTYFVENDFAADVK